MPLNQVFIYQYRAFLYFVLNTFIHAIKSSSLIHDQLCFKGLLFSCANKFGNGNTVNVKIVNVNGRYRIPMNFIKGWGIPLIKL